jgi:hypothetical protein
LGYTPPIQALMKWYPDKKGIASGLPIAGVYYYYFFKD